MNCVCAPSQQLYSTVVFCEINNEVICIGIPSPMPLTRDLGVTRYGRVHCRKHTSKTEVLPSSRGGIRDPDFLFQTKAPNADQHTELVPCAFTLYLSLSNP